MTTRYEILKRDMYRAIEKIVIAMEKCKVNPEGSIIIEVRAPKLDSENEFVQQLETLICNMSEMVDGFDIEEIRHIPVTLDRQGKRIPGRDGQIFGKSVLSRMTN